MANEYFTQFDVYEFDGLERGLVLKVHDEDRGMVEVFLNGTHLGNVSLGSSRLFRPNHDVMYLGEKAGDVSWQPVK